MTGRTERLARVLAEFGEVMEQRSVGGGCISEAMRVSLRQPDGQRRTLFAKRNQSDFLENFRCEAEGLRQLAAIGAVRVPEPLKWTTLDGDAWLVTEWIDQQDGPTMSGRDAFFVSFGQQLADLHRQSRGDAIGLDHDNFLGAARQVNAPSDSWTSFFQDRRLGFQLKWAIDQGLATTSLRQQIEKLIERLPEVLQGRAEETSLLHGDLWSGNYLCDGEGQPAIIDPAIYRGCREAEFGMLRLFGGCPSAFYEAYQEAWPMPQGWQRRVRVYVLYHLLNHLNLFGASYASQCRSLTEEILRDS